jgi:uncharacterized protein YjcR
MTRVRTKKELAAMLGVSSSTLRRWMNRKYFDALCETGYDKRERILNPKVLMWLCKHLDVEL